MYDTNEEFFSRVNNLLTPMLGYYNLENSQELALSFNERPRNVKTTVGLEAIVNTGKLDYVINGGITRDATVYSVLLLQNHEGDATNIHKALRKLQLNFRRDGSLRQLVDEKDVDFSQDTRKGVFLMVWFPRDCCGWNACDAALFDDPLALY